MEECSSMSDVGLRHDDRKFASVAIRSSTPRETAFNTSPRSQTDRLSRRRRPLIRRWARCQGFAQPAHRSVIDKNNEQTSVGGLLAFRENRTALRLDSLEELNQVACLAFAARGLIRRGVGVATPCPDACRFVRR
jgi:hypothetical protein